MFPRRLVPASTSVAARLLLSLVSLVLSTATGCTHVAPYQRARLAHPTMVADDATSPAAAHVYAVQEGATGGGGGAESGCGCN